MAKKDEKIFLYICCMVYFISYITRINFGAVISEIANTEGLLKSQLGLVVTAGFISYGAGQVISGFLGDVFNPKELVFAGFIATSVMNILLPYSQNVVYMSVIWCLNGLAQAFMWPPLVKNIVTYLDEKAVSKALVKVSMAGSVGTIAVYFAAPIIICMSGWRMVFYISGALGFLMGICWLFYIGRLEKTREKTFKASESKQGELPPLTMGVIISSGMIFIAVGIILQGMLRDGITTWLPSLISETFQLDNTYAIFIAVSLPILTIISLKATSYIYRDRIKNEVLCAAAIFAAGFVCLALNIFAKGMMPLSVMFMAVAAGCMHGVNMMLIAMVPPYFEKWGRTSFLSGALNAFTYVGSAISTYGFAKISEKSGWSFTIIIWAAIALAGTLFCFAAVKKWRQFSDV